MTGTLSNQTDLQNALNAKLSLASWYATTTDALTQGSSNRYYADTLVQTYLGSIGKGFFFSTTSADVWDATKSRWATTSSDYYLSQNQGAAFSTTSASYFLTQNTGAVFSTTSANYLLNSSSTIPRTTLANIWAPLQTFAGGSISQASSTFAGFTFLNGGASTTDLTISGSTWLTTRLASSLLSTDATGKVVATSSIGVNFLSGTLGVGQGGTGSTTLGGILKGNGVGYIQSAIAGTDYLIGSGTSGNCVKWGPNNTLADFATGCGTGVSSGGGTWATTTSQVTDHLINHPLYTTDIVTIGGTATSSDTFIIFDPNTKVGYINGSLGIGTTSPSANLAVAGNVLASRYVATSSIASILPFASSTAFTSTFGYFGTASTSNLYLSGTNISLLATDASGKVVATSTISTSLLSASSITINTTYPMQGGNTVALGGSLTLTFPSTSTLYAGTAGQVLAFLNGKWIGTGTSTYTGPLSFDAGTSVVSISQSGSGTDGYLSQTDWTKFNSKVSSSSLSALYPLTYSSGLFDLAFGTTTPNTWSALQTFANGFISNASSTFTTGLLSMNGGASTTNLTASGTGWFGTGAFTNTTGTTTVASGQGFTIGASQFVVQQGSGNVGIGTTNPSGLLNITKTHSASTTQEMFRTNFDGNWGLRLVQDYAGAGDIHYEWKEKYAGLEYNVLTFKNGNVGISTTSPSEALTVDGDTHFTGRFQVGTSSRLTWDADSGDIGGPGNSGGAMLLIEPTLRDGHWKSLFIRPTIGELTSTNHWFDAVNVKLGDAANPIPEGTKGQPAGLGATIYTDQAESDLLAGEHGAVFGGSVVVSNGAWMDGIDITQQIDNVDANWRGLNLNLTNNGGSTKTKYGFFLGCGGTYDCTTGIMFGNPTGWQDGIDLNSNSLVRASKIGIATSSPASRLGIDYEDAGELGAAIGTERLLLNIRTPDSGQRIRFDLLERRVSGSGTHDDTDLMIRRQVDGTVMGHIAFTGSGNTGSRGVGIGFNNSNKLFVNSSGNVGIGTTTPYSRLTVWGPGTGSTTAFAVVNNASTTAFAVYDNGNATYSGSIFQSSDERLKTDVQSLQASSSLFGIEQLNPVAYSRLDQPSQGQQLGFIAQDVQHVFPQLVSTSSPTALTPDGTLTVNYPGLIAPIVKAIQALAARLSDLANKVASFAEHFTTKELTFTRAEGDYLTVGKLFCLADVCVTRDQFAAMLAAANQTASPSGQGSAGAPATSSSTPPVITIAGNNPAHITVGDIYQDLGATAKDNAGHDLGVKIFLNGALVSDIVLDTSTTTTDTIDYVATDQNGLTSTSTRTVIVEATPAETATSSPQ